MSKLELIYGVHPVLEMLRANPTSVRRVLVSERSHKKQFREIYAAADNAGVTIDYVNPREFEKLFKDFKPRKKYFGLIINPQETIFQHRGFLIDHFLFQLWRFVLKPKHNLCLQILVLF